MWHRQGSTYFVLVAAYDAVGHRSDVVASKGQVFDGTPPLVTAGENSTVAQKDAQTGLPNAVFAADSGTGTSTVASCPDESRLVAHVFSGFLLRGNAAGYVIASCPTCFDDTSNVTGGGVALNEYVGSGSPPLPTSNARAFGPRWSTSPFLLGLARSSPLLHDRRYVVTCECVNGAST